MSQTRCAVIDIKGMHCNSCELLIEEELVKIPGVVKCNVSQSKGRAEIFFKGTIYQNQVEKAITDAGYALGKEERPLFSKKLSDYKELGIAVFLVFDLFVIANLLGLFKLTSLTSNNFSSLPVVFLIGLTAGISTCMALVGGLILGASARFAEKHPTATTIQKFTPHIFFNLGRVISYFILGGVIGYIGSFFQLSPFLLGFLIIAVGFVMLLLGLQLINISPLLNSIKFTLPKQISQFFGIHKKQEKEYSHANSFAMGALTFFLPCGFTQAMILFAMASGKPLVGSLTLGIFALGTTPGLLGIGGLTSAVKGAFARHFFRFAGVVVVGLSLFNISNGYNLVGFRLPNFFQQTASAQRINDPNVIIENGIQVVRMTESAGGYSPNSFTIQQNVPVKWIINAEEIRSCASSIVSSGLNIRQGLREGENVITFTPTQTGTIGFSCIMGMYTGAFTVIPNLGNVQSSAQQSASNVNTVDQAPTPTPTSPPVGPGTQVISATYTQRQDIQPNQFQVTAGKPVHFEIDVKENGSGCMGSLMIPGVTQQAVFLTAGKKLVFDFTPQPGRYLITCSMGTPRGVIQAL